MQRRYLLAALLLAYGSACAETALAYKQSTPLYTRDRQAYAVAGLSTAVERLIERGQPLVLFIHGRGDEPHKSLRPKKSMLGLGSAVPMLEGQYGAAVLMFNWDAKGASRNDRVAPLLHASEAADSLRAVMGGLRSYYAAHPQAPRFVLLAHSMGTIVVQRYVERYGWNDGKRLFANVLLTSADADNVGHALWVERISAVERVFITVNPGDKMLRRSTDQRPEGVVPLGQDPGTTLAGNAIYVEIGSTGHHEIFDKADMGGYNLCQLFVSVLHGMQPDFDAKFASVVVENQRYRLLPTKSTSDSCSN